MHMLGHHHIPSHDQTVTRADLLENFQKQVPPSGCAQQWTPMITTESDEVQVSSAVVTMQPPGHGESVLARRGFVCDNPALRQGSKYPAFENRKGWGNL